MKKFFMALAMCIATIGFTSCGKDSEDLIVGKWELYSQETCYMEDGSWDCDRDSYNIIITFNEDGTFESLGMLGRWSISGDSFYMNENEWVIEDLTSSHMRLRIDGGDYIKRNCFRRI